MAQGPGICAIPGNGRDEHQAGESRYRCPGTDLDGGLAELKRQQRQCGKTERVHQDRPLVDAVRRQLLGEQRDPCIGQGSPKCDKEAHGCKLQVTRAAQLCN